MSVERIVSFFSEHGSLANLALAEIEGVDVFVRSLTPGECLNSRSRIPNAIALVEQGWLYISCTTADGRQPVLHFYGPGSVIVLDQKEDSDLFAHAGSAAEILCIRRDHLNALIERHPKILDHFLAFSVRENASLLRRIADFSRSPGKARLAGLLLELHELNQRVGDEQTQAFPLSFTQGEIGDAIGLTKIHVNRLLKELEKNDKAIARTGRTITIRDKRYLIELSGFLPHQSTKNNNC